MTSDYSMLPAVWLCRWWSAGSRRGGCQRRDHAADLVLCLAQASMHAMRLSRKVALLAGSKGRARLPAPGRPRVLQRVAASRARSEPDLPLLGSLARGSSCCSWQSKWWEVAGSAAVGVMIGACQRGAAGRRGENTAVPRARDAVPSDVVIVLGCNALHCSSCASPCRHHLESTSKC